jgi:hypothetical protein
MENKSGMGICAYIDILGFKYFVNENQEGAIKILQNYQVQLELLDNLPKKDDYLTPYRMDSIKYLIPFSDSIFLYSEQPSEFVMQLANFINSSFSFTSSAFSNPENPDYPEDVTEIGIVWEDGKPITKDYPSKWFPLLFRGGIGYGDARIMELKSIHNNNIVKTPFVFGTSVLEAVKMESIKINNENIKGPRIICTSEFYEQLNERTKKIVHKAFDLPDFYEVNWTAIHYLMTDDFNNWRVDNLLLNDFYLQMFVPATGLWKAYRTTSNEKHYKNFLKLVVKGVQHFFNDTPYRGKSNIFINDSIEKEGLNEIGEFLIN